jgi:glutamate 5-kinase
MRKTLSQIKEEQRKMIAMRDKLVVLRKAQNGQIIEVLEGQWVETNFLDELKQQAILNRQEVDGAVRTERIAKEELVMKRFELLAKEYEDLTNRMKELEHEIKVIKGLE